jgi:hypothetical protein
MPPVEFESTISAGERQQNCSLDRAATGTGNVGSLLFKNYVSFTLLQCKQNIPKAVTRNEHNRLQQPFINSSNLFPDVLFQLLKCTMFVCVHFGFQVSPEKVSAERYGDLAGQAMSLKSGMTRTENMALARSSDSRAVCAVAPSCWIQEFAINTATIDI